MSGSAPTAASQWDATPFVRKVRLAAVAVLQAAQTLAGSRVYDSPMDDWAPTDLPAIAIYQKTRRDPRSAAGTSPQFNLNMTLRVECTVLSADPNGIVAQLDQLDQQAIDALLGDPYWLGLVGPIGAIETTRNLGRAGESYRGQAMHEFAFTGMIESFPTNPQTPLVLGGRPIGVPNATNPTSVPLATVSITEQGITLNQAGAPAEETLVAQTIANLNE